MRYAFKYGNTRGVYGTPNLFLNDVLLDKEFRSAREFVDFIELLLSNWYN